MLKSNTCWVFRNKSFFSSWFQLLFAKLDTDLHTLFNFQIGAENKNGNVELLTAQNLFLSSRVCCVFVVKWPELLWSGAWSVYLTNSQGNASAHSYWNGCVYSGMYSTANMRFRRLKIRFDSGLLLSSFYAFTE